MKLKSTILILSVLLGTSVWAQDESDAKENQSASDVPSSATTPAYLNKGAVGISVGTTGIGIEYAHNITPKLNARLRGSMFGVSDYTTNMEFNNNPVQIVGEIEVKNVDLLLEFLPFSGSSFKLIGGGSYFISSKGAVQIIYDGELKYGDIVLTSEDIGDITIGMDYSGFAPYMGLGFGRAVPKKRVGLSMEFGTYYAGSPKVSLTATEMFAPTAAEEKAELEANLSGYKWLPYLTVKLAVRI